MSEQWREKALCRHEETSFWFPHPPTAKGGAPNRTKMRRAMQMCQRCPVQAECLQSAIDNNEEGIWGGHWFRKTNRGKNHKIVTIA